jgi:ATP-dependent Lon protease
VSYAASGAVGNVLSGADKNWGNSSTGIVFNALAEGEFANPVIVLDEIDKASSSSVSHGIDRNPLNELLALLEPITAREHKDRCAEIRVDARHIVWIATANSLDGLSAPLLSRFKLILINKPDARAAVTIALSVTQAVTLQMGVSIKPPSGEVLQLLATLTPRTMRRIWTGAAGWATASGRDLVTIHDIEQSLGLAVAPHNHLH